MKINYILPCWIKSGGIRIIVEYANRLEKKGYDVKLYYPKNGYDLYKGKFNLEQKFKKKIKSLLNVEKKFEYGIFENKSEVISVKKINSQNIRNADFTIATAWPTAFDVMELNHNKGRKVYFVQGYETWNSNLELVNASYKLPINKITISKYLKDLLYKKFNQDAEVILNGINYDIFDYKYGIKKDKISLLFIYYGLAKKNMPLAFKLVKQIKSNYPDIEINSFGFIKRNEIPNCVNFYPDPDQNVIVKLYCENDIFLYTSNEEGFGLPPAEAMACKTAVVSSCVGAIPEYAEHSKSAFLVENNDFKKFYEGIELFIINKDLRDNIALNAYNDIRKKLNWYNTITKFENYLRKLS